jgi:hypothetical protein
MRKPKTFQESKSYHQDKAHQLSSAEFTPDNFIKRLYHESVWMEMHRSGKILSTKRKESLYRDAKKMHYDLGHLGSR